MNILTSSSCKFGTLPIMHSSSMSAFIISIKFALVTPFLSVSYFCHRSRTWFFSHSTSLSSVFWPKQSLFSYFLLGTGMPSYVLVSKNFRVASISAYFVFSSLFQIWPYSLYRSFSPFEKPFPVFLVIFGPVSLTTGALPLPCTRLYSFSQMSLALILSATVTTCLSKTLTYGIKKIILSR